MHVRSMVFLLRYVCTHNFQTHLIEWSVSVGTAVWPQTYIYQPLNQQIIYVYPKFGPTRSPARIRREQTEQERTLHTHFRTFFLCGKLCAPTKSAAWYEHFVAFSYIYWAN